MEQISYINYSSTVKNQKKREGIRGIISFWFFLLPMIIVCGIFVTVSIIHLYMRNQIIKYSYDVPLENKKQKNLLEENKTLKSQLSLLLSPARIEKYANSKLNMRLPLKTEIIELKIKDSESENYIGYTR